MGFFKHAIFQDIARTHTHTIVQYIIRILGIIICMETMVPNIARSGLSCRYFTKPCALALKLYTLLIIARLKKDFLPLQLHFDSFLTYSFHFIHVYGT